MSYNHGFLILCQKLKHELYDYDPDTLRPYLELSHVQKGVLALATKLYGITFKENKHIPVYHPDVIAYDVFDKDEVFGHTVGGLFPKEKQKEVLDDKLS